jgi:hypothetical protein
MTTSSNPIGYFIHHDAAEGVRHWTVLHDDGSESEAVTFRGSSSKPDPKPLPVWDLEVAIRLDVPSARYYLDTEDDRRGLYVGAAVDVEHGRTMCERFRAMRSEARS